MWCDWLYVCRFDPDRFSADRLQQLPLYAFEPFGFAGKRICPGRSFALSAVTVLLAKLMRSDLELRLAPDQTVSPKYDLTGRPEDEVWIAVDKRKWHLSCCNSSATSVSATSNGAVTDEGAGGPRGSCHAKHSAYGIRSIIWLAMMTLHSVYYEHIILFSAAGLACQFAGNVQQSYYSV